MRSSLAGKALLCAVLSNSFFYLSGPAALAASKTTPTKAAATSQSLPVFNAASYGASGATDTGNCSGQAGSKLLTGCKITGSTAWAVGGGVHIVGMGNPVQELAITTSPQVQQFGKTSISGTHMYCYVVAVADPFEGITAPSPQTCIANEPEPLSVATTYNMMNVSNANVGYSPTFLWYVSEDGGNYRLLSVAGVGSGGNGQIAQAIAMDTGQRSNNGGDNRGGWPDNLSPSSPQTAKAEEFYTTLTGYTNSGAQIADPLPVSFTSAKVLHDDTRAVQKAIDAAVAAGGGTVQLNNGRFQIMQPSFVDASTTPGGGTYPTYTTTLSKEPFEAKFHYLHIANGSAGKIHLKGSGSGTLLVFPPDHGGQSHILEVGAFGRPAYMGAPAYTTSLMKIAEAAKGATSVTVQNPSSAPSLNPGDDVWLYTGTFGSTCVDQNGTPGGQCHYSELNTVSSYDSGSGTVQLVYPTSKRYYQDSAGSSFGMVKMPVTPHDIAIMNMSLYSYIPVLSTGMAYNVLIDSVISTQPISYGPFGGGFKRNVTVQNSSWVFGAGDAWAGNEDEYDQMLNVSFINDTITGYAAPGAEGPSAMARMYATEGSSQFTYQNNTFNNASVYFDQTTDDVLTGNQFINGIVNIGTGSSPSGNCYEAVSDPGYTSYSSQANADIESNVFQVQSGYAPPFIVRSGSFDTATIANNTVSTQGTTGLTGFAVSSGNVSGNQFTFSGATNSIGFCVAPNQTQALAITLQQNTINASSMAAGVYVPDPGFVDDAAINLLNNVFNYTSGYQYAVANPSRTPTVTQ